ncbi:hypothetical protein D3C71_1602900 [compost metagenome]
MSEGEEGGEQQDLDGDGEQVHPHVVAVAPGQHLAPAEYNAEAAEGEGEAETEADEGHQGPLHAEGGAEPEQGSPRECHYGERPLSSHADTSVTLLW